MLLTSTAFRCSVSVMPSYQYFPGPKRRDPVLASIVHRFAEAVARLRSKQRGSSSWTSDTQLWDEPDDDGGWAAAAVPLHPPDKSGSGSVGLTEPNESDDAQT